MDEMLDETQMDPQMAARLAEEYNAYMEAVHHETHLFSDDYDKVPFLVDFSKVDGILPLDEGVSSVVMLGGNTYVISTPYEVSEKLWKLSR